MNFNLKEITWQDAESLEPGSKLWVGQTREKAVEGIYKPNSFYFDCDNRVIVVRVCQSLNLTPYIPTTDPVDISPAEAAARMVEGLPVECKAKGGRWVSPVDPEKWSTSAIGEPVWSWRIPACPPAKQKLTIEVDAGVEVPDKFRIWTDVCNATAKVIHREGE